MKKTTKKEVTEASESRYITRVHIENFQDHTDTVINLEKGINLITGSSDAGKSAALRAINFVLHNQPRGDAFVQLGSNETRVAIEFSDGTVAQRIKGKSRNAIVINNPKWAEPIAKDNFGNEYPEDVIKALGNPPVDKEQGPISYADQMSPLFLVSLSSTELPRCLSRLTGIDDFEEAEKILSSQSKDAAKRAKENEIRINRINEELDDYKNIENQICQIEFIDRLATQVSSSMSGISEAQALISQNELIMSQGKTAFLALQAAKNVHDIGKEFSPIEEKIDNLNTGLSLLKTLESIEEDATEHKIRIEEFSAILDHKKEFDSLEKQISSISLGHEMLKENEDLLQNEQNLNNEIRIWTQEMNSANKEYSELIKEMMSLGAWCEACSRPLVLEDK